MLRRLGGITLALLVLGSLVLSGALQPIAVTWAAPRPTATANGTKNATSAQSTSATSTPRATSGPTKQATTQPTQTKSPTAQEPTLTPTAAPTTTKSAESQSLGTSTPIATATPTASQSSLPSPTATATRTPTAGLGQQSTVLRDAEPTSKRSRQESTASQDVDDDDEDNDNDDAGDRQTRPRVLVVVPTAVPTSTPTALPPEPSLRTPLLEQSSLSTLAAPLTETVAETAPVPTAPVVGVDPDAGAVVPDREERRSSQVVSAGTYAYSGWYGSCDRALEYWDLIERSGQIGGADPQIMAALLTVESSGERAVSPAGAMGLMQLMPDKFRAGDDPFDVPTNLLRAAEHIGHLQARLSTADRVAAAYFGAIDSQGNISGASDGNVDGFEYARRFEVSLACVRAGLGVPGETYAGLVSPFGGPLTRQHISFGFLDDYGPALASYIRGAHGVAQYGTRHLAWDLIVPGAPANGRGHPVLAPMAGRVIRTSDPAGGPFGIWLENRDLNLRVRLMHMDGLAPEVLDGAQVRAGQLVGVLGAQGTEEFPHLHLSIELLSTGERLDPARFYFRPGTQPVPNFVNGRLANRGGMTADRLSDDRYIPARIPGLGAIGTPKASGNTIIWSADGPAGRGLTGYDLDLGWAFRIGRAEPRTDQAPAIGGSTIVWLDTRHVRDVVEYGRPGEAAGLADVYRLDLKTGEERRLTMVPGRYADLVVTDQLVAWINDDPRGSEIEVYNLASGNLDVISRGRARLSELAISGRLVAWRESGPGHDAESRIRAHNLLTGESRQVAEGRVERPAIVGSNIFWEEQIGAGPRRSIAGRNLEREEARLITPAAASASGLRASDGVLVWDEVTESGESALRLYGVSSGELLTLATGPATHRHDPAIGHGTVVWRDADGDLAIRYLLDWDLPDGHFYADPNGEYDADGRAGYWLTNEQDLPFWERFNQLGGTSVLGRPLSNVVTLADGLPYVFTEHALLQWRPDLKRVVLANSLELLGELGHDEWLHTHRQVPRSSREVSHGDRTASGTSQLTSLSDPAIRKRFLDGPAPGRANGWTVDDSTNLYGLPMSPPEDFGPFIAQRFQRAVFQRWKASGQGDAAKDAVTLVRVGEIFRSLLVDPRQHPAPIGD